VLYTVRSPQPDNEACMDPHKIMGGLTLPKSTTMTKKLMTSSNHYFFLFLAFSRLLMTKTYINTKKISLKISRITTF